MKKELSKLAKHDRRALARLISAVENNDLAVMQAVLAAPEPAKPCYAIGITGAPGVGKSTLVNALISKWVSSNPRSCLGILAVDPSSPLSGGAVLGDRIRMVEHTENPNIFIRSLASRGSPDGLPVAIPFILKLLALYGSELCMIETVGSGQLDIMIKACSDSTLLVLSPDSGDDIQMMKAGIMEIADILVINKSDRKGLEQMLMQLKQWQEYLPAKLDWLPPIVKVQANHSDKSLNGMNELYQEIERHQQFVFKNRGKVWLRERQQLTIAMAMALFRRQCEAKLKQPRLAKQLRGGQQAVLKIAAQLLPRK